MSEQSLGLHRRSVLACAASVSFLGLTACGVPSKLAVKQETFSDSDPNADIPPAAPREFRAAWVATVANIDWPSRKGLSSAAQQSEVIAILDRAALLKLNAIILQVRPCADALYNSALEPWSEYLSGTQGLPPSPWYDPLAFWIAGAHERGLELHAWFNPFRARLGEGRSPPAAQHVSQSQPHWVKSYGNQLWIDPGESAAASHTLAVIEDVLSRYDVDGIHIDDYFYPYPVTLADEAKTELDFPDQPSWQRYLNAGGGMSRDDWRRSNVDALVQRLNQRIHQIKPWVRFGISPFGLGRPELRPPGIQGFSQYHKLYANVERWLQAGWLDYLVPQLYWPLDQKEQAFGTLLDYWHGMNSHDRHVWAGLFTSQVRMPSAGTAAKPGWLPEEITRQITAVRQRAPGSGHAHFSMVALLQDRQGLAEVLRLQSYAQPALVPATPWLEGDKPMIPDAVAEWLSESRVSVRLTLTTSLASKPVVLWAIWLRYGTQWYFQTSSTSSRTLVVPAQRTALPGALTETLTRIAVSAIDRVGNESPSKTLNRGQIAPWSR